MNGLQIYAMFVAPLLMAATALAVYFVTKPRRDERNSSPAE